MAAVIEGARMGRNQSPSLAINSIPQDVLDRALNRARSDGWISKNDLFIELLRDYADGAITPRAAPPPFDPTRRRTKE